MSNTPEALAQRRELAQVIHSHSLSPFAWDDLSLRERRAFTRMAAAAEDHFEAKVSELCARIADMSAPAARATDPETSHIAAEDSTARKHHRRLMLAAYWNNRTRAISDHEAADDAGLLIEGICWWKRASDLRAQGLIEWATDRDGKKVTAMGMHGRPVGLCVLTRAGRRAALGEPDGCE